MSKLKSKSESKQPENSQLVNRSEIGVLLREARLRTLELVADLTDEQMMGPCLSIVNPLRWEIGHVAWFQEKWTLRNLFKQDSVLKDADALYDSAAVAHDIRWDLPLPSRKETLTYMQEVLDRVIDRLDSRPPSKQETYFYLLALFHEYMHSEAFAITRQTLGYPLPSLSIHPNDQNPKSGGPLRGDVEIPGGTFMLGATTDLPFVFDNEKWAHPIELRPYRIARAPVTNIEFAAFVDDKGYQNERWWSEAGWIWRQKAEAQHPVYWQRESNGRWFRRRFDQIIPLQDHLPVINVNWYEADAYCRWAGRRLPAEAEWELAASADTTHNRKRIFPWGDELPNIDRGNLDWRVMDCIEVGALPDGDSAFGCRQMIGNVWEWTSNDFLPYPGFVVDPYKEYSEPWFETHKVLRGGCWATRSNLIRNTWRNFYTPDRRDIWAGFRTCAQ